jgi:hypothetical protein
LCNVKRKYNVLDTSAFSFLFNGEINENKGGRIEENSKKTMEEIKEETKEQNRRRNPCPFQLKNNLIRCCHDNIKR